MNYIKRLQDNNNKNYKNHPITQKSLNWQDIESI